METERAARRAPAQLTRALRSAPPGGPQPEPMQPGAMWERAWHEMRSYGGAAIAARSLGFLCGRDVGAELGGYSPTLDGVR
eukprot:scaffold1706_cov113-Isochrysis_galbana.AAC.4